MDDLDQVCEGQMANYHRNREHLCDEVSSATDIIDLYQLLSQMVLESGASPDDVLVTASQFLLSCRYHLTLGTIVCLQGHITDSFFHTRKAIEFCAFAARVKKQPHLAMVWLSADDSADSYKKYRKKFKPGGLFPKDHVILGQLYDRYDFCSKMSHPSLYSVCRHLKVTEQTETSFSMEFDYFDSKNDDSSEPIRTILSIVDTHFLIIRVLEEVFGDVVCHDRTKWDVRRNVVDEKIALQKAKWKSVIQPVKKNRDKL